MRIKIHGGTPAGGEKSLCITCRHSRITRGRTLDEELVLCGKSHFHSERITFTVVQCSDYDDNRMPSYYELLQQAWILQPGTRRRPAGFVRASELRDEELLKYLAARGSRDER